MNLFKRIGMNRPKFVFFDELGNQDYPTMFGKMKSDKRSQEDINMFAEICMSLKRDAMIIPDIAETFPIVALAVEKDEKVWFFELGGDKGKFSPLELVEPFTKLFNPNMFVVIAESWFLKSTSKEMKDYDLGDISSNPKRRECLIVDGRTRNGQKTHVILEVKRTGNEIEFSEVYTDKIKDGKFNARYDMEVQK